jgi:hypothetical protein
MEGGEVSDYESSGQEPDTMGSKKRVGKTRSEKQLRRMGNSWQKALNLWDYTIFNNYGEAPTRG